MKENASLVHPEAAPSSHLDCSLSPRCGTTPTRRKTALLWLSRLIQ